MSTSGWQPPRIPSTIGSSFSSWLRPNRHSDDHTRDHQQRKALNQSKASSASSVEASGRTSLSEAGGNDAIDDDVTETLPNSPTLEPPVPVRYREKFDQLAASAELWLYSHATPYFQEGRITNVSNPLYEGDVATFAQMWREASGQTKTVAQQGTTRQSFFAEDRATMSTQKHHDGKVAAIRWIAVDPEPAAETQYASHAASRWMSWLRRPFTLSSSRPQNCLNVLEIGKPEVEESQIEEKIVLLHGYGAGTGFFFQNIAALASRPSSRLYAIDWLGMGRSSRPPYYVPSSALKNDLERVRAAESFFVDSLEEWRKKAGVEKMTLVGHSLGGYLSVAFALRYPEQVSRLVLVSPAGVGASPEQQQHQQQGQKQCTAQESAFTCKNASLVPESLQNNIDADAAGIHSVDREVLESQQHAAPVTVSDVHQSVKQVEQATSEAQAGTASATPKESAALSPPEQNPPRFSPLARALFGWLWEQNFSPFGFLRSSQFLGPWLTSRYTQRRFATLPEDKLKALHAYCQGIFLAPGSGEYCCECPRPD